MSFDANAIASRIYIGIVAVSSIFSASNVAYQPFLIFFATVITESYLSASVPDLTAKTCFSFVAASLYARFMIAQTKRLLLSSLAKSTSRVCGA